MMFKLPGRFGAESAVLGNCFFVNSEAVWDVKSIFVFTQENVLLEQLQQRLSHEKPGTTD